MKQKFTLIAIVSLMLAGCSGTPGGNATTPNNLPAITLEAIDSSNLPALQAMVGTVSNDGKWLILGGMTGGFHDFEYSFINKNIYVFDPDTNQLYSVNVLTSDLPLDVKQQLTSVDPVALNDSGTEYLIGGYYNHPVDNTYTTLNTITSIDIQGLTNAAINHESSLAQYVHYSNLYPQFRVTAGGLGKIGSDFYLAFGHNCEGVGCDIFHAYTNSIYQFTTSPNLEDLTFNATVSTPENSDSGFRRRGYNLVPFNLGGSNTLLAMAGGFQNTSVVWTNNILIYTNDNANIGYNTQFSTQLANQYLDAFISMHSTAANTSYVATFSGLSNLYWDSSNNLAYNVETVAGNILDLISYNANTVQEYANKTPIYNTVSDPNTPLYMGTGTVFLKAGNYYDDQDILQLDKIHGKTFIGYLYGGMLTESQLFFGGASSATNQVYKVYITPNQGGNDWVNVTGMQFNESSSH